MPAHPPTQDKTSAPRPAAGTLQRASGTSLHRQLFLLLREQITRGLHEPGSPIPTEEQLCALFGVSRITVRRALADLEREGLVEKRQGRGTFVSRAARVARRAATLSLVESLRLQADATRVKVLSVEAAVPPGQIALQLQLAQGEPAVRIMRLRYRGRTPVMISEAWVPESLRGHVTARNLRQHPMYEVLLGAGLKFGSLIQEITAVSADPNDAGLLRVDAGVPLLRLTRLLYDRDRHPVLHLTLHVTPQRSRILMDLPADVDTMAAGHVVHDVAG